MKRFANALECNLRGSRGAVRAWGERWRYATGGCRRPCGTARGFGTCRRELTARGHGLDCGGSNLMGCDG